MSYARGTDVKLRTVISVAAVNTDPTTLTLEVLPPGGTITSYTYASGQITRSAAGDFYKVIDANEAGTWRYRWAGTGTAKGAGWSSFRVTDDAFN